MILFAYMENKGNPAFLKNMTLKFDNMANTQGSRRSKPWALHNIKAADMLLPKQNCIFSFPLLLFPTCDSSQISSSYFYNY